MASQPRHLVRDTLEFDLVSQFGFSAQFPIFELYTDDLTLEGIFDAFRSIARERPSGIHFSFGSTDDWMMLLVPEGLHALDSGPSNALRGEVWHDYGAYWVISGWAQLYKPESEERFAGACRVRTPRWRFGQEPLSEEPCVGQLELAHRAAASGPIAFITDPRSLRP